MCRLLGVTCLLLSMAVPVGAQTVTATTGAINGTVIDSSKAVVPGVTVSLSGPALMGISTAVTDAAGAYRFSAVPPGDYTVAFELTGFGTVTREGIHIGIGLIATVNVEMTPGGINETLTVSGLAPVVDVTSSSVATTFDSKSSRICRSVPAISSASSAWRRPSRSRRSTWVGRRR